MSDIVKVGSDYLAVSGTIDPMELLRMNLGEGAEISASDLVRVSVPTGGAQFWSIETIDGLTPSHMIEGVIVGHASTRSYFSRGYDETGGTAPDCYSLDMVNGTGEPGGLCAECPYSKYESALKGRGQACSQRKTLYVLRQNDLLPIAVSVSPMSLGPVNRYFVGLLAQGLPFFSVVTSLALTVKQNSDGLEVSVISPSVVERLDESSLEAFAKLAATYRKVLGIG